MLRQNHAQGLRPVRDNQRLMALRRRKRILPRLRVLRANFAAHLDSALLQERAEQLCIGHRRIFDRDRLAVAWVAKRNRSPESYVQRSRLPQYSDISSGAARGSSYQISDSVIV